MGAERAAGEGAAGDVHRRGQPAADVEPPVQRLAHVTDAAQVRPDVAAADAGVVAVEDACLGRVGAGLELLVDRVGCDHARAHRVVDALELGHVHEAGSIAGEDGARDGQPVGQGEQAALGDRLRAPADPLATLEQRPDQRVRLELLEQVMHGERGVAVVEPDDQAERDLVLAHRVDEAAAALPVPGLRPQRPAERVDDAIERACDPPQLLHAEAPDLRVLRREPECLRERGGQVALRALGEHGRLRVDLGAGLVRAERLAVAAEALVARDDAADGPAGHEQRVSVGLRQHHDP